MDNDCHILNSNLDDFDPMRISNPVKQMAFFCKKLLTAYFDTH